MAQVADCSTSLQRVVSGQHVLVCCWARVSSAAGRPLNCVHVPVLLLAGFLTDVDVPANYEFSNTALTWTEADTEAPEVTVTAPDTNSDKVGYLVTLTAFLDDTGANDNAECLMGFTVKTTTTPVTTQIPADASRALRVDGFGLQASATYLVTVPDNTSYIFKAAFKETDGGANIDPTCKFAHTNIVVSRASGR